MTRTKKLKVKDRVELEKKFLSCILNADDTGDMQERMACYEINWRRFRDKRHRAIWRALETIDFKRASERADVIREEGFDMEFGEEGSAAQRMYFAKLHELISGPAWFEHELAAAGTLALAGGKVYLRKLAAAWPVFFDADFFAEKLGFSGKYYAVELDQ